MILEGFSRPFGVNQNSRGEIAVADFNSKTVFLYSADLKGRKTITNPLFVFPHSVEFDREDNLIVCDFGAKAVLKFDREGNYLGILIKDLMGPASAYLDPNGNLVVSDYGANMVKKFSPNGILLRSLKEFDRPHSVGFDRSGKMYVCDTWNHRIRIYTPEWELDSLWPADFKEPVSISFSGDRFVVSEYGSASIRCFSVLNQKVVWENSGFNHPYDVKLKGNRLIVADSDNHRVVIEELS